MFGQIVSGIYGDHWEGPTSSFEHLWTNTCLLHLDLQSKITDWFTAVLGFEISVRFSTKGSGSMNKALHLRTYMIYMPQVTGLMHWNFDNRIISSLKITSGLFPYTFNPTVKTLGNYLFRSTNHPPSVQNKIDYPWTDLLGVHKPFIDSQLSIHYEEIKSECDDVYNQIICVLKDYLNV